MDSSFREISQMVADVPDTIPVALVLERGLEHVQQGRYAEGVALLKLVSECITPEQMPLDPGLKAFIQEYEKYQDALQLLYRTGIHLARLDAELRARITTLHASLPALLRGKKPTAHSDIYPHAASSPLLQIPQIPEEDKAALLSLYATCLAPFEVRCSGVPLKLCSNRNGQAILRYLIAQPEHSARVDTLMTILWPDDDSETALRKLQVTVSILRRSLCAGHDDSHLQGGYILYRQGSYQINPSISIHSDVEDFLDLYNRGYQGRRDLAIPHYEQACSLYNRPFLVEDMYVNWSYGRREQLRQIHLRMCSTLAEHYLEVRAYSKAAQWASKIVEENSADETAHQLLMRIYALEGRRSDALQQYHRCQQILLKELGVQPVPETVTLYRSIVNGEINPQSL